MKYINFQDYGIIFIDKQRYYKEDLSKRDYLLENTSPYYFKIGYDEFLENSWFRLLESVINYLLLEFDPSKEDLLNLSLDWSNKSVFSETKMTTNSILLNNGLYVNLNYSSLHSCWFLQDLLKFFDINFKEVELIIRRQPCVEKKEVREYFIELNKEQFKKYITEDLKKDKELYIKIIDGLDKADKLFKEYFPAWVSIYLFDNVQYLLNYKIDFFETLDKKINLPDKTKEALKKRENIYYEYFKKYYK